MIRAQSHAKQKKAATPAGDRKTKAKVVIAHRRFAREYIANNHNGSAAAISAGYSKNGAHVTGIRLLRDPIVARMIEQETERALKIADLEVDRVIKQIARIGFADPLKLLDDAGKLLPLHLWPPDIAAAVQSVEFGPNGEVTKIRFWNKVEALGLAMRHHGLLVDRRITEPPPPADPDFAAKRKQVMDAVWALLAAREQGKNLDKPIIEGVGRLIPPPAPAAVSEPATKPNGKGNGKGNGQ